MARSVAAWRCRPHVLPLSHRLRAGGARGGGGSRAGRISRRAAAARVVRDRHRGVSGTLDDRDRSGRDAERARWPTPRISIVTLQIALWGTALAVMSAIPLGLASSSNVAP